MVSNIRRMLRLEAHRVFFLRKKVFQLIWELKTSSEKLIWKTKNCYDAE